MFATLTLVGKGISILRQASRWSDIASRYAPGSPPIRACGAQGGTTRDSHDLRTKAMLVRFTPAEFALVQEHARSCRRTMARYVRETTLGSVPHTRLNHDADAVLYHIGRIGNNVNQLAHVANATDRLPTEEQLTGVLDELRALIRHLAGTGKAS